VTPAELARLTRKYKEGDRVVAIMDIVYCSESPTVTIPEGSRGTVVTSDGGVCPRVAWDDEHAKTYATGPDGIDPLPDDTEPDVERGTFAREDGV
jgi:hypothetical protein